MKIWFCTSTAESKSRICVPAQDHKRDLTIVDSMLEEANRIRDSAKQAQETLVKLEEKRKQLHDKCQEKDEEFGKIRSQLQDLDRLLKEQKTVVFVCVTRVSNMQVASIMIPALLFK